MSKIKAISKIYKESISVYFVYQDQATQTPTVTVVQVVTEGKVFLLVGGKLTKAIVMLCCKFRRNRG
jgi:hypothetical protein